MSQPILVVIAWLNVTTNLGHGSNPLSSFFSISNHRVQVYLSFPTLCLQENPLIVGAGTYFTPCN